jgi:hypothetical protein
VIGGVFVPARLMASLCRTAFNVSLKCMINLRQIKYKRLVNLGFC